MLSPKEKTQIRTVLEDEQRRLAKKSENALAYSMNHERNIGRDSIDESMEEEIFSTEMRLHDREKFLLGKINKQLARLDARRDRRLRGLRRDHLVPAPAGPPGHHALHRLQGAERARGGRPSEQPGRARERLRRARRRGATARPKTPRRGVSDAARRPHGGTAAVGALNCRSAPFVIASSSGLVSDSGRRWPITDIASPSGSPPAAWPRSSAASPSRCAGSRRTSPSSASSRR